MTLGREYLCTCLQMGKAGTERQKWSSKVTQFLFEFKLGLFRAHLRTILHSASLCMGIFIGRYLVWYLYLRDLSKVLLKATEGFPINGVQRIVYLHSYCSKQCWSLEASELCGRCLGEPGHLPKMEGGELPGLQRPQESVRRREGKGTRKNPFTHWQWKRAKTHQGSLKLCIMVHFFQETSKLHLPKWR